MIDKGDGIMTKKLILIDGNSIIYRAFFCVTAVK